MQIKKAAPAKMLPTKPGKSAPPPLAKKAVTDKAKRPMNTMGLAPSSLKNKKI